MATVLEEFISEEQSSVVRVFGGTKVLFAEDIHKEMFPFYGGKCMSRKALHSWVANVSLMKLKRWCGSG
jgi:hypothetical protein